MFIKIVSKIVFIVVVSFSIIMPSYNCSAGSTDELKAKDNNSDSDLIVFIKKSGKYDATLAITDESGSFVNSISPIYSMITSVATCPTDDLIAYSTRNKNRTPKSYIKNGIKGKPLSFLKTAGVEDFNKDCSRLLYTSADKKSYLYLYSFETKKSHRLLKKKNVLSASWSPDNSSIILGIMMGSDGKGDLYLLSYPGLKLERLTNTPDINEFSPSFLSDDLVIYTSDINRSGQWNLETINIKTGQVIRTGIKGGYASVLNSKNKIVYEDIKKKNIHIYDFGDSTNTVLVTGGRPFTFSLNKVKSSPNECSSKEFNQLLNIAETQTQAGNYIEALDSYTKAYDICPMRDLEEQMAWLLSEIGGK